MHEDSMTDFDLVTFFPMTTAGVLVTMISALISSMSSFIVLNVIRLSPEKLSTTHHRIMTLMSLFDVISSVNMALVTLPMPTDNRIAFSGPMLGNLQSCRAQAFLICFGIGGSVALYTCLSWYYVFQITLRMHPDKIRFLFEPMIYLYSIFISVFGPVYFLINNLLGPDPHYAYCVITYYIEPGRDWNEQDTYQFNHVYKAALRVLFILSSLHYTLISVAMIIIIFTIYRNTQNMRAVLEQLRTDQTTLNEDNIHKTTWNNLKQTRAVLVQALMYIMAYFLTWIFQLLFYVKYDYYTDVGIAILFPSQGFWNMIIFIYDKVQMIYQTQECDSRWIAVKRVIFSPSQSPGMVMTNLNSIILDEKEQNEIQLIDALESSPDTHVDPEYDDLSLLKEKSVGEQHSNFSISESVANRDGFLSISSSPSTTTDRVLEDQSFTYVNNRKSFRRNSSQE